MLAALGSANQGPLASGIGGILEHGSEFFVFEACFFPFVRVEEILGALVLQFGSGVREFAVQILVQARKSDGRVFRFIGKREFVIESLVVLGRRHKFAGCFVGAGTNKQKRGLGGSGRISSESLEAFERTSERNRGGNVGFEDLFLEGSVWKILQKSGEILGCLRIFLQGAFTLRGPEEGIFLQERVAIGFLEPDECLRAASP